MLFELAISALFLGLGGLMKGATGMGLPLVAVPALAAFLGVPHALALMTVPVLTTNAWQVWRLRGHRHGLGFLAILIAASVVGVAAGTWLLVALPAETLALMMSIVIAVYIAVRLLRPDLRLSVSLGRRMSPAVGLAAGVLHGSTGISAPVAVTFVSALRLSRPQFVFAVSTLFLGFTVTQVPSLAAAGVLTLDRALVSAFAVGPVLLMMPVGQWLAEKLSPQAFDRLILAALAGIAAKLLFDSRVFG
jgi:uncharacterized membrane protein YfcA